MSELSTVAKAMFALGFTAVLAVMIFGSSGPTLAPIPSAPQFNNPFEQSGFSSNAIITQQVFVWAYPTVSNITSRACSNLTYFNCVSDPNGPDSDDSYLIDRNTNLPDGYNLSYLATIDFGITAPGADWTRLTAFSVSVYCRWDIVPPNNNKTIKVELLQQLGPTSQMILGAFAYGSCTQGTKFINVDMSDSSIPSVPTDANAAMTLQITIFPGGIGDHSISISTIYLSLYFSANAQCTGNGFFGDLACQIGNFFRPAINALGFVIGIVIFIGQGLWAGVLFLTNFFIIIRWLYSIPGLPSSVQLFVSSYVSTLFGIIIISVVRLLRGGSP